MNGKPITINLVYLIIAAIVIYSVFTKGDPAVFFGFDNEPEDSGTVSMTMAEQMYLTLGPDAYLRVYEEEEDGRVKIQMEDTVERLCELEGKRADHETMKCVEGVL